MEMSTSLSPEVENQVEQLVARAVGILRGWGHDCRALTQRPCVRLDPGRRLTCFRASLRSRGWLVGRSAPRAWRRTPRPATRGSRDELGVAGPSLSPGPRNVTFR